MFDYLRIIVFSMILFTFSSCLFDPSITKSDTKFKQYKNNSNNSIVYIYRVYNIVGSASGSPIYLDNNYITTLNIDGYYVAEISPGKHTIGYGRKSLFYEPVEFICSSNNELYIRLDTNIKFVAKVIATNELNHMYLETNNYNVNESTQTPKHQYKNVIVGTLLGGGISLLGALIPGTYGWGNFYAGDYTGFWILNIGGSIFTVCTLTDMIRATTGPASGNYMSTLGYVGLAGWGVFCIASEIWGLIAVNNYNDSVISKISISLSPLNNGITFNMSYKY